MNINELLFSPKYLNLDIEQSQKMGFDWLMTKHGNFMNHPVNIDGVGFANFSDYSVLLYHKGGHTLLNRTLDELEELGIPAGCVIDKFAMHHRIFVPIKDPIDKFISAFFTCIKYRPIRVELEKVDFHHPIHSKDGQKVYDIPYNELDKCVDDVLAKGNFEGLGRIINNADWVKDIHNEDERANHESRQPNYTSLYDLHFIPIHILLSMGLQNYNIDVFHTGTTIVGAMMEDQDLPYFVKWFKDQTVPQDIKAKFMDHTTANTMLLKHVGRIWIRNNPEKVEKLKKQFFSNDYILIDWLIKNNFEQKRLNHLSSI